jgi:hypothetical protein
VGIKAGSAYKARRQRARFGSEQGVRRGQGVPLRPVTPPGDVAEAAGKRSLTSLTGQVIAGVPGTGGQSCPDAAAAPPGERSSSESVTVLAGKRQDRGRGGSNV